VSVKPRQIGIVPRRLLIIIELIILVAKIIITQPIVIRIPLGPLLEIRAGVRRSAWKAALLPPPLWP